MRIRMRSLAALLLLGWGRLVAAGEGPFPDPLTLEMALSLADAGHPQVQLAEAERDLARASVAASEAQSGLNVWLEGRLRYVEPPSYAADQSHDDHKLSLYARKSLYDFGRTAAQQRSAEAELRSRELRYLNLHSQRRVEIMQRYFEVLLADMEFARDDEAMAVAYVTLDKLRQRHELGQVSDIDLLQQEASYQQSRRQRAVSETRQRATREALAIMLGRPGLPPSNLDTPEALVLPVQPLPEYAELLAKALRNNPLLRALQAQVAASRERVAGARAGGRPTLFGEAEASAYSRELGSNDPLRLGVVLQVPLYSSGAVDAAAGQEQARLYRSQAELLAAENEVRQTVLQLWQELALLRIQQEEALAQMQYRELYLDRSRANYEMEVSTDLGDAMVRLSEAQLAQARARFQLALGWERLLGVTGDSAVASPGQSRAAGQAKTGVGNE